MVSEHLSLAPARAAVGPGGSAFLRPRRAGSGESRPPSGLVIGERRHLAPRCRTRRPGATTAGPPRSIRTGACRAPYSHGCVSDRATAQRPSASPAPAARPSGAPGNALRTPRRDTATPGRPAGATPPGGRAVWAPPGSSPRPCAAAPRADPVPQHVSSLLEQVLSSKDTL